MIRKIVTGTYIGTTITELKGKKLRLLRHNHSTGIVMCELFSLSDQRAARVFQMDAWEFKTDEIERLAPPCEQQPVEQRCTGRHTCYASLDPGFEIWWSEYFKKMLQPNPHGIVKEIARDAWNAARKEMTW